VLNGTESARYLYGTDFDREFRVLEDGDFQIRPANGLYENTDSFRDGSVYSAAKRQKYITRGAIGAAV